MDNKPKKSKVFLTRQIPKVGVDLLKKAGFRVRMNPSSDKVLSRKELLRAVRDVDALLSLLTDQIDKDVFDAAGPQLKVVANYAVGYNNVDVAEAKQRGIIVGNTPSAAMSTAVAEHTFALMMCLTRRVVESDLFTRAGKYKAWAPDLFLGRQIQGKVLGIVGLGRIGKAVAQRAVRGMGMKVMYYDVIRDKKFEKEFGAVYKNKVEDVLRGADVVTIHVPLMPTTYHLINARRLGLMKKTAYLINTSRGPVVDEAALAQALQKNKIAGAALDVFEFEPKIHPGLLRAKNVALTPHTASATHEAREEMAIMAAKNIIAVLNGQKAPYAV